MQTRDWIALAIVLSISAVQVALSVDSSLPPAEDAAMLMRYAQHLADGHGIVWNVGERPIDGATDFFFMTAIAGGVKAGVPLEIATRALIFAAHVVTVGFVFVAVRVIIGAPLAAAIASCVYLIFGPASAYVSTYFGAPVFAMSAAAAWLFALAIMRGDSRCWLPAAYALCSLVTGLVRPEGVILASLMLIAIAVSIGWNRARISVLWFIVIFATLGLSYFLWRWNYFGHPLPNPFYKKGGGALHLGGLKDSMYNTIKFTLPLLPLYAIGLAHRDTRRATIAVAIPMFGFACSFILISSEMNFAGRFQYAILPMALMAWPIAMERVLTLLGERGAKRRRIFAACVMVYVIVSVGFVRLWSDDWAHYPDGRAEMGRMLLQYKDDGLRIATSEAGLIPLYSQCAALDTWGLNDSVIARKGTITAARLDTFKPDLIVFHAYDSPAVAGTTGLKGWSEMVAVLRAFVAKHGFELAAAYGVSSEDLHYYYVRSDFAGKIDLMRQIAVTEYIWSGNGEVAKNFATNVLPN
ncbi:MAG: hypothetical protein IT367_03410 [Candidatus Hydrogenedentes bacterium]|nr:hypothetical protein [Candidatus Hydrogenedentota bacterium]